MNGFLDVTDAGVDEKTREMLSRQFGYALIMDAQRYGQNQMFAQACDGVLFYEANEETTKVLKSFVDSVEFSELSCEFP